MEKIDIQNESKVQSREVFRLAAGTATTYSFDKCVLGFLDRNSQQDIIYQDVDWAITINMENCICYNAYRAVIDIYDINNNT